MREALLAHAGPEIVDTAVLLASELITNAVLHGRSEVELTVEINGTGVKVSAADMNSRLPVMQSADELALDGRGIAIVDLLASSWGVSATDGGKIVWFCLDLSAPVG